MCPIEPKIYLKNASSERRIERPTERHGEASLTIKESVIVTAVVIEEEKGSSEQLRLFHNIVEPAMDHRMKREHEHDVPVDNLCRKNSSEQPVLPMEKMIRRAR